MQDKKRGARRPVSMLHALKISEAEKGEVGCNERAAQVPKERKLYNVNISGLTLIQDCLKIKNPLKTCRTPSSCHRQS